MLFTISSGTRRRFTIQIHGAKPRQSLRYTQNLHQICQTPSGRFLARSPTINFSSNIADSFRIHALYRIRELNVKSKSKKWNFEYQKEQIQIARFSLFCWDIIYKSQGLKMLKFLFLSELTRIIV